LLSQRELRRNLNSLGKFLALLVLLVFAFAELFHLIMRHVEDQKHSWVTGLYWTLTVMTTLGFGDITFQTDLGRIFSIVVLLSGVVLLLIVLPFTFIRFFYAPWLEAQIRLRAPRSVPPETKGHVIVCRYDHVAPSLIKRFRLNAIPYVVIEPDATRAGSLMSDGVSVVTGEVDSAETYERVRAAAARLVVANTDDATNCNITLTVREHAPKVPILTFVEDRDAVDILTLSGASHVVPIKHRLGEHLASRASSGAIRCHEVGRYGELRIGEFPVHGTMLVGRTIRDTRLRELTGLNIVGYWDRGRLQAAKPDSVLTEHSVAVVVGDEEQIAALNAMFVIYKYNENPVVAIGGGKVGRAAIRALKAHGMVINVVEKNAALEPWLTAIADKVVIGDAADRDVLDRAGIDVAPSVVLTANDDAINIYLAVYCRKLNPDLRIVSRITHERNLEAIHRAGADFVLSYTTLAAKYVVSYMLGRDLVILGEGVDVYIVKVPPALQGKTLGESGIGAKTGLNVVGVQGKHGVATKLTARTLLERDTELVVIGTSEQRQLFQSLFQVSRDRG
jgi:Trk K+ transport system NAD-binding subunit